MQTASYAIFRAIPQWVEEYISVPFEEGGRTREAWDCWGLIVVVMQEHFGIELPIYSGDNYTEDNRLATSKHLEALVAERKQIQGLHSVEAPKAKLGDIVILNILGRPIHIGLVVTPGIMLHTMKGIGTVIENYEQIVWAKRVEGFYRHELLCSN